MNARKQESYPTAQETFSSLIETSKLIMDKLEREVKADLTTKRGMIVTDNVDIPAFKKAGEKAYEVLKIADVKKQIFSEIGKK